MRPHDLLRRGHPPRQLGIRPLDAGPRPYRSGKFAPADRKDAARATDLVFLRRQRHRIVGLVQRFVPQSTRRGIETELVVVPSILDGLRTLHNLETKVERVSSE